MVRLADLGERMKPRLLPPTRLALVIMAVISFVAAVLWGMAEPRQQMGDANGGRSCRTCNQIYF